MVKREFLSLMRSLLVAEKVLLSDCSDGDIERHCFHKDRIIDYGCYYLAAVGSDESTNRGKISERFQIGALRERADGLWWFIVWFLLEYVPKMAMLPAGVPILSIESFDAKSTFDPVSAR